MILILTENYPLAEGLMALLRTFADATDVMPVRQAETALRLAGQGTIALLVVDGGLALQELTSIFKQCATTPSFPPILFLMESTVQKEIGQQAGVTPILKGGPTVELISTVEMLLKQGH